MSIPVAAGCLIGGYLLGSIPFGVILMRFAGAGDPREIGSRNIGATNVLRSGRVGLAVGTLIGDGGKGMVAVLLAHGLYALIRHDPSYGHTAGAIAGGAAFLGHLFPVWLGFKGGKGVATFFGVLLGIDPLVGLACILAWIFVFLFTRISSLSALVAAAIAVVIALAARAFPLLLGVIVMMATLIFIRHHANIRRLLRGEEPRFASLRRAA